MKNHLYYVIAVLSLVIYVTTFNYGGCGINNGVNSGSSGSSISQVVISPPLVITNPATNITQTSATLNGKVVNPNGIATTVYFNYQPEDCQSGVLTTISQTTVRCTCDSVEIWDTISGLSTDTTYSFRCVATNAIGTTYGNNLTFTTAGQ